MGIFTKWLSRNLHVAIGMSGLALCLSVLFFTGSLLGQQASSHAEETKVAFVQSATARVETKPQRWTILCEREDGTQGVFRVSSKLMDQPLPLEDTPPTETVQIKEPSSPEQEDEIPANDEDPFGDSSLQCGRLLTLLALFGTAESQTP